MTSKGIYPYECIDNYTKLYETQLPPQQEFYSTLYSSECNDEDYKKALDVWDTFQCKTMIDYHNLYLSSDVLLLTDIWENLKNVCYNIYNLDVSFYYKSPGLSWDAFLKHTDEYYTEEYGKHFESSIRGGLSQTSKRYAKANKKYITDYDKSLMDKYI